MELSELFSMEILCFAAVLYSMMPSMTKQNSDVTTAIFACQINNSQTR